MELIRTSIYDIVFKKEISVTIREAENLGIHRGTLQRFRKGDVAICVSRFCHPQEKERLVKTVIEMNSGLEFEALRPESLFYFFGNNFSKLDKTNFSKVLHGAAMIMSIQNYVFCLKENLNKISIKSKRRTKNSHIFDQELKPYLLHRRIKQCLSARFNSLVRKALSRKFQNTMQFLGCSIEYFFQHIESQFKSGMSWDNYGSGDGKWEIDHIIPCNLFDLSIPDHQKACFFYKNMRPLWSNENKKRPDDGSDLNEDNLKLIQELGISLGGWVY